MFPCNFTALVWLSFKIFGVTFFSANTLFVFQMVNVLPRVYDSPRSMLQTQWKAMTIYHGGLAYWERNFKNYKTYLLYGLLSCIFYLIVIYTSTYKYDLKYVPIMSYRFNPFGTETGIFQQNLANTPDVARSLAAMILTITISGSLQATGNDL